VSDKQVAVVDAVLSFSIATDDERFAPCVIKIAHSGLNQHKSVISKEVFERNAKTAYGCPIVCNYDAGADYIGGHDKAIVRTEDGARLINMTHPVGYVPEGSRYWWETIVESGEEKEYLWPAGRNLPPRSSTRFSTRTLQSWPTTPPLREYACQAGFGVNTRICMRGTPLAGVGACAASGTSRRNRGVAP